MTFHRATESKGLSALAAILSWTMLQAAAWCLHYYRNLDVAPWFCNDESRGHVHKLVELDPNAMEVSLSRYPSVCRTLPAVASHRRAGALRPAG
jgi:hypothetical protein